jgi:hypothetical protein
MERYPAACRLVVTSGELSNDALNPTVASRPLGSLVRFRGRVAIRRPAPAGYRGVLQIPGERLGMIRRQAAVLLGLSVAAVLGWVLVNPPGEFGLSQFGVTTYNRVPVPYFDLQVRADGATRWILKTHYPTAATLAWLVTPTRPDVLVVGLGWRSGVRLDGTLSTLAGLTVRAVPTDEALSLYNSLKAQGVRVAIHLHSTC